jgi:hypothetical protein
MYTLFGRSLPHCALSFMEDINTSKDLCWEGSNAADLSDDLAVSWQSLTIADNTQG